MGSRDETVERANPAQPRRLLSPGALRASSVTAAREQPAGSPGGSKEAGDPGSLWAGPWALVASGGTGQGDLLLLLGTARKSLWLCVAGKIMSTFPNEAQSQRPGTVSAPCYLASRAAGRLTLETGGHPDGPSVTTGSEKRKGRQRKRPLGEAALPLADRAGARSLQWGVSGHCRELGQSPPECLEGRSPPQPVSSQRDCWTPNPAN